MVLHPGGPVLLNPVRDVPYRLRREILPDVIRGLPDVLVLLIAVIHLTEEVLNLEEEGVMKMILQILVLYLLEIFHLE